MSEQQPGLSYRDAGVNIDAANEALDGIKNIVNKTFNENVLQDIGSFGAMYRFDPSAMEDPIFVSSVDGVGTKLKLAFMTGKHDTVGIDLVSHCVNDILVQGARPLFFLDYLACGALAPEIVVDVIQGIANGCRYAGCALIGGETAEMPGMYAPNEYDLAGTIVGVVDRKNIIDGSAIEEGDVVIGLRSSGLHTNGYSLARKVCFEVKGMTCDDALPGTDRTIGEALLEPHRSYATVMQILMRIVKVRGMAHITGGGITENLPRVIPKGLAAEIDLSTWEVPPVFTFLKNAGNIADPEMLRTFNMGMGYLVVVSEAEADKAMDTLCQATEEPALIGRIIPAKDGGESKAMRVNYKGELRYAE